MSDALGAVGLASDFADLDRLTRARETLTRGIVNGEDCDRWSAEATFLEPEKNADSCITLRLGKARAVLVDRKVRT